MALVLVPKIYIPLKSYSLNWFSCFEACLKESTMCRIVLACDKGFTAVHRICFIHVFHAVCFLFPGNGCYAWWPREPPKMSIPSPHLWGWKKWIVFFNEQLSPTVSTVWRKPVSVGGSKLLLHFILYSRRWPPCDLRTEQDRKLCHPSRKAPPFGFALWQSGSRTWFSISSFCSPAVSMVQRAGYHKHTPATLQKEGQNRLCWVLSFHTELLAGFSFSSTKACFCISWWYNHN